MAALFQTDFGGGIWADDDAPPGYVRDARDAVVDERSILKRGAAVVGGPSVPFTPSGIFAGHLPVGRRVSVWSNAAWRVLNAAGTGWDAPPLTISTPPPAFPTSFTLAGLTPFTHGVGVGGGYVAFRAILGGAIVAVVWAGSRMSSSYTTGTISYTAGSKTVTGTLTAFISAGVDKGALVVDDAYRVLGQVETVDSDTQLTLRDPVSATGSGAGFTVTPWWPVLGARLITGYLTTVPESMALGAVGSNPRLVVAMDNRAYFSQGGDPWTFGGNPGAVTDYHELSPASRIIGLASIRDALLMFTTAGVWEASNMDFDLTDDAGNVQQRLAHVDKDAILWGEAGLAGWRDSVVAPTMDDVFLFGQGGPASLGRPIRSLYRSYVDAGYRPGPATVIRGHYLLPVLDGSTWVDTLVCRLDQSGPNGPRPAWTRWRLGASATAYARAPRVGGETQALGISGTSVLDVAPCTDGSVSGPDADGTGPQLNVVTTPASTGPENFNSVRRLRLRYDMAGASATVTRIHDGVTIDTTSLSGDRLSWRFTKRCRLAQFQVLSTTAGTLRLRSLEAFVRPSNRP
jgi:hypothetical protein